MTCKRINIRIISNKKLYKRLDKRLHKRLDNKLDKRLHKRLDNKLDKRLYKHLYSDLYKRRSKRLRNIFKLVHNYGNYVVLVELVKKYRYIVDNILEIIKNLD